MLADGLGLSSSHTAHLCQKHLHLLSQSPCQLQQDLRDLCVVLHWPSHTNGTAAAFIGAPAFLQLIAADPKLTQMQLAQLAEELQASPAACAAFAQHYPQQLLQEPHAAAGIQQQLQTLAQAAGVRIGALLEELDPDQSKGLAALLLYEAGWISAQLRKLTTLVQELLGYAVPGRSLVWLLLRLGTPDNFFILMSPTSIKRRLATLQRACMAYSPWQQQLQQATDRELAVLLAVGADAPQWMLFLAETGRAVGVNVPLVEVVCWRKQEFARQFDMDDFLAWQGTRQQESSSC